MGTAQRSRSLENAVNKNVVIISAKAVSHLKKKAKLRKQASGCAHHAALDEVAKEAGFPNWHHLSLAGKETVELERRFKKGLFLLMDIKEGVDAVGENFELADEVFALRDEQLMRWFREADPEGQDDPESDVREALHEGYVCLRYIGSEALPRRWNVVDVVTEMTFWQPSVIWLRGELIDPETDGLDEEDLEEGVSEPMPVLDESVLREAFGGGTGLVLHSADTMEYYKAFEVSRKAWNWCLHCERAYPQGSYRQVRNFQMCPYQGCNGNAVTDLWTWWKVRSDNPGYPQVPELGVEYSLYGS